MEFIRVSENWQRAGVYFVRTQAMVKGFNIPLHHEFDNEDAPETKYILAIDGIYPIATCRLHLLENNEAKIERVCVIEEYRNKGVGSSVITAAEAWLKDLNVKKVTITSRDQAVKFYESLGYVADYDHVEDTGVFPIIYTHKNL